MSSRGAPADLGVGMPDDGVESGVESADGRHFDGRRKLVSRPRPHGFPCSAPQVCHRSLALLLMMAMLLSLCWQPHEQSQLAAVAGLGYITQALAHSSTTATATTTRRTHTQGTTTASVTFSIVCAVRCALPSLLLLQHFHALRSPQNSHRRCSSPRLTTLQPRG